jgi:hypothetical protein
MVIPERVYERIIRWADRDHETGCLVSRYSLQGAGYAQVGWHGSDGKRIVTTCHRALWIHLEGSIPDGYTVDHICHNRRCVEREHLRLLTNFENARRTSGRDWPLGECINGHSNAELFTDSKGRQRCRPCNRTYQRTYYHRRKAAGR